MQNSGGAVRPDEDMRLGQRALERGFITAEQLREALAQQALDLQRGRGAPRRLGNILLGLKHITESQLVELLQEGRRAASSPPSGGGARPSSTGWRLGRYEVVREIGRGGMGVVYEAVDPELKRKVALKMLLSEPGGEGSPGGTREEERFLREARLSAKLGKHPHIVGIYEAGVWEGRPFIAMEYIEGRPMSEWRKTARPPLRAQIRLLREVALAVHQAHKAGIIHRDLKPANILVDAGGELHVTDFGLAKSLRRDTGLSLTVSGAVMGTPSYMSPEQARGLKKIDRWTDVYALGAMLYEILTGRTPFRGATPMEILLKTVQEPVPPPSSVLRAAGASAPDAALERICLRALEKDPEDRYPSALALAESLGRWLEGGEPAPEPVRWRDRKRMLWAGGAGAAAVLGVVLALLILSRDPEGETLRRAEDLARGGRPEEAWKVCQGVLKRRPAHEGAQRVLRQAEEAWLGQVEKEGARLAAAGRYVEAEEGYEKFLAAVPRHERAEAGLRSVRDRRLDAVVREAEQRFEAGEVVEALVKLGRVLSENPGHAKALALKSLAEKGRGTSKPPERPAVQPPPEEPKPAPPAASAGERDPNVVEVLLGPEIEDRGIRMMTPPKTAHEPAVMGGLPCLKVSEGRLYFDVDDDWAKGIRAVEVEVEFFGPKGGYWNLRYDSRDLSLPYEGRFKSGCEFVLSQGDRWERKTVRLEDPRFENRQDYWCDFRIGFDSGPIFFRRIAVRRVEPGPQSAAGGDPEGWISVFSGVNLSGWEKGGIGPVLAEDGVLTLKDDGGGRRKVDVADYELRGGMRLDGGAGREGHVFAVFPRRQGTDSYGDYFRFHMDGDVHWGEGATFAKSGSRKCIPGRWLSFLMRFEGDGAWLTIEGRMVLKGTFSRLEPGVLRIKATDSGSSVSFRELQLRKIPK